MEIKGLIFDKVNIYNRRPCNECPSVLQCKGTDAFYNCSQCHTGIISKLKNSRHPDVWLIDGEKYTLLLTSNI